MDIYEKALEKKWHTQSRNRILSYYLDDIMELRHSYRMVNATIRNFLNLTLDHVFEISHENKALLTEQPYFYWVRFIMRFLNYFKIINILSIFI